MKLILTLITVINLLPMPALAKVASSGQAKSLTTFAICSTAIQRNLVQIRGDGNQVRITVTKNGMVVGNIAATRKVKGEVRAANLEIEYVGMTGFANLSCNSEPAGIIRINGTTDYLACNAGPDARAIQLCNNRWSRG